ncbi:MAG: NAD(P)-dependent oxidoreductase [bacterium]|nr:NAD(P)-dependent oxidoreductase [bacterium]
MGATSKKKLLAVGGSGLVGSRILSLLENNFSIQNFSLETGLDITDPATLSPILNAPSGSIVFHLAAKADVDSCEKDKPLGENGPAWKINVEGARNVALACAKARHTMVYVSTDFVFSGENTSEAGYTEEDSPDPLGWYAVTKYEGEKAVVSTGVRNVIMRIAYPYRSDFKQKLDFVRAILTRLASGEEVKAVTDHIMTPTFIDDIAIALKAIAETGMTGIYHVVGSSSISPYEAVVTIASMFQIEKPKIEKISREAFFSGRAPRPFNLTLNNDKIMQLGVKMRTFEEGLKEMKLQGLRI